MRSFRLGVVLLGLTTMTPALAAAHARAPAEASAASSNKVAVLPTSFVGEIEEAWRDKMSEELVRGLVRAGFDVVSPADVAEQAGTTTCDNDRCIGFISESTGARYVVRSRIKVTDKHYELFADVLDGRDGSLVASSAETCDLCGATEVGELIAAQAASLQQKIESLALGPAIYTFVSDPPGARVYIDGQLVGTTPLDFELRPGEYEAKAKLAGHLETVRTITAVKGVKEELAFTLQPAPTPDEEDASRGLDRQRGMWIAGATMVGVGAAALAAGITFLVLDERPYKAGCSGADVDALGNCRQRYNTLIHGAVLTGIGGATVGTGAGFLVAGRKRKGKPGAQARLGFSLTGVTLRGRF